VDESESQGTETTQIYTLVSNPESSFLARISVVIGEFEPDAGLLRIGTDMIDEIGTDYMFDTARLILF
jgi:hypothetical protein